MNRLYSLLLEIRDLLKNKNIEIDNNSGQVAGTVKGNQIQNNFYSYNTFKPLKNFKGTIKAYKSFVIEKEKYFFAFIIFIFIGLYIASIIPNSEYIASIISNSEDNKALCIFFSFFGLSFLIYIIWFLSLFFNKLEITINENGLIIDKKDNIEYKNIRSFLMEKNLFSYSFFIYEIDKIEPLFKFKVYSIHEALAIEELLKSKLITKEKNENRSKE